MSDLPGDFRTRDAVPVVVLALVNGLTTMARRVEPILRELAARLEPLTRSLETAAPIVQAVGEWAQRWDAAEACWSGDGFPTTLRPLIWSPNAGRRCQTTDVATRLL